MELDTDRLSNSTGQSWVGDDLPTGMSKNVQPLKVDKLVGGEVGLEEISEVDHPLHIACRGLYNPAAHRRLLNVCRDCYNLFREAEVFSTYTANAFTLLVIHTFIFSFRSVLCANSFTLSHFHTFHVHIFTPRCSRCAQPTALTPLSSSHVPRLCSWNLTLW